MVWSLIAMERYSQEFFIQRSFEVVWAVFRVCERVSRPHIKELLEKRALAYLNTKDLQELNDLEEGVKLAFNIGEVNQINTRVLLREIGNLKASLGDLYVAADQALEDEGKKLEENSVEEIFSTPPMLFSDFAKMLAETGEVESPESPANEEFDEKSPAVDSLVKEEHISNSFSETDLKTVKKPSEESGKSGKSGKEAKEEVKMRETAVIEDTKPSISSYADARLLSSQDRRKMILAVVKGKQLCHMKDIQAVMPEISDRTLRYDIRNLMEADLLERVGTGGPHSFFRYKGVH